MRFFILLSTVATLTAGYTSNGYGGNSLMGGSSNGGYSSGGGGGEGRVKGPITAAIESQRSVEVRPVQSMPREPLEPQVIEVPSDDMPVTVHFKSQSSRVLIQQTHTPAAASEPEHTSSEDEPQRVIHEVVKPVIQEVREIIQPYRRLIQQIQPVIEQTHTVIAKGEPRPQVAPLGVNDLGSSGGASSGAGRSVSVGNSGVSAGSSFGGQMRTNDYAAAASSPQTSQMAIKSVPESVIRIHKPTGVSQAQAQQGAQQGAVSQVAPAGGRAGDQPSKFPMAIQQLFAQHGVAQAAHDQHQPEQQKSHHHQQQYHHQGQQQQQQQYSKRQGDIGRNPQYTPAKMTLRPAPVVKYLPIEQLQQQIQPQTQQYHQQAQHQPQVQQYQQQAQHQPQVQQYQQQAQHQPQQQSQYQRRSARFIAPRGQQAMPAYAYQGYELTPEEMQLLSFVAQPVRFRARA